MVGTRYQILDIWLEEKNFLVHCKGMMEIIIKFAQEVMILPLMWHALHLRSRPCLAPRWANHVSPVKLKRQGVKTKNFPLPPRSSFFLILSPKKGTDRDSKSWWNDRSTTAYCCPQDEVKYCIGSILMTLNSFHDFWWVFYSS